LRSLAPLMAVGDPWSTLLRPPAAAPAAALVAAPWSPVGSSPGATPGSPPWLRGCSRTPGTSRRACR
jgi:hypothetical protein